MNTIAVIGAGFSGTLLVLHLLRRCPPNTRIHLIERNRQFGPGAAYATGNPNHLLNVPAGRMSAFRDRPRDFLDWLGTAEHAAYTAEALDEKTFVPRQRFGAYIRALLLDEMNQPRNFGRLKLSRGDVLSLDDSGDRLTLHLDRGRQAEADLAVLAIGNFPPEPPPGMAPELLDGPFYRPDPWAPDGFGGLDPHASVLLIGTGLTTIDAVVTLLDRGHVGPIHALSRRGLLPRCHGGTPGGAVRHAALPTGLRALTRLLRQDSRRALAQGGSWQAVIDELRPFTQDIWLSLSSADRGRFLRHLRPWWDVHRHRMAPAVSARIEEARGCGQLMIHAGRIREFRPITECDPAAVEIVFRRRGDGTMASLKAQRIINCAGPGADYGRITHPLIRSLLASGLVRPDALRLGLDVTGTCALRQQDGAISRRLFAVGPVTKGAFWEMTAVPDIRRQCEFLGEFLAGHAATLPTRL